MHGLIRRAAVAAGAAMVLDLAARGMPPMTVSPDAALFGPSWWFCSSVPRSDPRSHFSRTKSTWGKSLDLHLGQRAEVAGEVVR